MHDANIEKCSRTAYWYHSLQATTNETFLSLYEDQNRHLILCGGAGSGKSIFAGRKLLERITSEADHRMLVCRKIARTLRESCFRQLCDQLRMHYDPRRFKINHSEMMITYLPNGSRILFAGLDDVEKLKSIYRVTGIWIEEASELSESDYDQLNIRLRGRTKTYKQIIATFNPVDINHWLKRKFFDQRSEDVTAHRSTYRDNRFLDDEQKTVLESFRQSDPYYYRVYCLGEWGVFGKSIFDAEAVSSQILKTEQPRNMGRFTYRENAKDLTEILWQESADGEVMIYHMPEEGHPYVIGGDTAGDGNDRCTAQVIDNSTGRQVAVLCASYEEDVYARQVYCLGKFYHDALIGIEANFSTYPIRELERLGYPKQYVRQTEDTFTHRLKYSYGFKTTALTRPIIVGSLVRLMREDLTLISDRATLEEMLTFVRNAKGRTEAQNGAHDDLIMALAIAYHIREQQETTLQSRPVKEAVPFFSEKKSISIGAGERLDVI